MEEFIKMLVLELVNDPESVKVSLTDNHGTFQVKLNVNPDDCGTIVGKGGGTIKAIRDLAGIYQKKHENGAFGRIFISVNEE